MWLCRSHVFTCRLYVSEDATDVISSEGTMEASHLLWVKFWLQGLSRLGSRSSQAMWGGDACYGVARCC